MFKTARFRWQHRKASGSAMALQMLCCGFNLCGVLVLFFINFECLHENLEVLNSDLEES